MVKENDKFGEESHLALFDPPTLKDLWSISLRLKELFFAHDVEFVFTGTSILTLLGLRTGPIKDIDILINMGKDETVEKLQKTMEDYYKGEVEDKANYAQEMICALPKFYNNMRVELFYGDDREIMQIATDIGRRPDRIINVSRVDDMFKKKWLFNEQKTNLQLVGMIEHLESLKPELDEPCTDEELETILKGTVKAEDDNLPF